MEGDCGRVVSRCDGAGAHGADTEIAEPISVARGTSIAGRGVQGADTEIARPRKADLCGTGVEVRSGARGWEGVGHEWASIEHRELGFMSRCARANENIGRLKMT